MIAVSENMYIDKHPKIIKNCNNTTHRAIYMKFADVKTGTYINFDDDNNT